MFSRVSVETSIIRLTLCVSNYFQPEELEMALVLHLWTHWSAKHCQLSHCISRGPVGPLCHAKRCHSHASLIALDLIRFASSFLQSKSALPAEIIFLRKQLTLYQERQVQPRQATNATRLTMVWMARPFDWKEPLPTIREGRMLFPGDRETG